MCKNQIPSKSSSHYTYFDYMQHLTVLLQAVVDADITSVTGDAGWYGKQCKGVK
jgi:hypothetical protein